MFIRRFIPAYAGNSSPSIRLKTLRTVHPRLRGELCINKHHSLPVSGSSPLTRGTLHRVTLGDTLLRFIPAYAGNSPSQSRCRRETPVHPRLRGELSHNETDNFSVSGSSPLTRGTPRTSELNSRRFRFIPAYAGNSLKMVTTLH